MYKVYGKIHWESWCIGIFKASELQYRIHDIPYDLRSHRYHV